MGVEGDGNTMAVMSNYTSRDTTDIANGSYQSLPGIRTDARRLVAAMIIAGIGEEGAVRDHVMCFRAKVEVREFPPRPELSR